MFTSSEPLLSKIIINRGFVIFKRWNFTTDLNLPVNSLDISANVDASCFIIHSGVEIIAASYVRAHIMQAF